MSNKVFQLLGEIIINYSKSEIDQATEDAKKLKEELEGIETNADEAGEAIKSTGETGSGALGQESKIGKATIWLGNAMYDITLKAMNLGKQLISAGMEYNAAMEGYETNFTTLLGGDSERAKQLVKDLELLAAETPLDTAQTAKAAQDLLIYGTAVDDIIPTLKMMGDITLGNADRMGRFALAYNQMLGKGKLMAQEQNQMTEAAVPIVDIVLAHLGLTREAYEAMREEGLLAATDVKDALFAATQAGGDFYGGMARTMGTYEGQMQRTAEIGKKSLGKLFEPFFEVVKSDVLPQVNTMLEGFYNWCEKNQDTIKAFAETLAKIAGFSVDGQETIFDRYAEAMGTIETEQAKIEAYIGILETLAGKETLTAAEQVSWNEALEGLKGLLPGVTELIDDETRSINGGADALRELASARYEQARAEAITKATDDMLNEVTEKNKRVFELEFEILLNEQSREAAKKRYEEATAQMYEFLEGVDEDRLNSSAKLALNQLKLKKGEAPNKLTKESYEYILKNLSAYVDFDSTDARFKYEEWAAAYEHLREVDQSATDKLKSELEKAKQEVANTQYRYDAMVSYIDEKTKPKIEDNGSGGGNIATIQPSKDFRLDYFSFWTHENAITRSGDYLSQAIAQMNNRDNGNASQIISLLSSILAATNRPIVLNTGALVGAMSSQLNAQLGRDFTQRAWR